MRHNDVNKNNDVKSVAVIKIKIQIQFRIDYLNRKSSNTCASVAHGKPGDNHVIIIGVAGTNGFGCGYPGAPAHSSVRFIGTDIDDVIDEEDALLKDTTLPENTTAMYSCERGFELLGPTKRICQANGTWTPEGVPFCGK